MCPAIHWALYQCLPSCPKAPRRSFCFFRFAEESHRLAREYLPMRVTWNSDHSMVKLKSLFSLVRWYLRLIAECVIKGTERTQWCTPSYELYCKPRHLTDWTRLYPSSSRSEASIWTPRKRARWWNRQTQPMALSKLRWCVRTVSVSNQDGGSFWSQTMVNSSRAWVNFPLVTGTEHRMGTRNPADSELWSSDGKSRSTREKFARSPGIGRKIVLQ